MLYAAAAMQELHADNGPANSDPAYDVVGELPEELPRGLVERLEDLQRRLGRCEGRLELSQVVQNLLRKQLQHESERAARLQEMLREAETALRAAEATLNKTRGGWLRSFFGMGAKEE
jgi:chromosome segregation ATPase